MKFSNSTTISSAIENLDFVEIYNNYALWIDKNRWAWKSGNGIARQPFHIATRPNGLTAFAKANYNFRTEKDVKDFQGDATDFLSDHPELIKEKADIFCQMFPALIQFKLDKKQEKNRKEDKGRDANLRGYFDMEQEVQMEIPVVTTTVKSTTKLFEITQSICEIAKLGAKSIKSPDGWEIQF
jgi:hypothetical protein